MFAKRIIRSAVIGAIIVASLGVALIFMVRGGGATLTEQEFQASYPAADYFANYLWPSMVRIAFQGAIYGGIIGGVLSLIRWAFSRDKAA